MNSETNVKDGFPTLPQISARVDEEAKRRKRAEKAKKIDIRSSRQ
jgi:hypothetical protein